MNSINKYFIIATKQIELRGIVKARNRYVAKELVKEHWHTYDHPDMDAVIGHTSDQRNEHPKVAEYESKIKILHIEDVRECCQKCGKIRQECSCLE